jgi:virginiamycin B lyase
MSLRWGASMCVAAILVCALIVLARTRLAPEPATVEYRMLEPQDIPASIALGPDGSVWFTLDSSDAIGRLSGGQIQKINRGGETLEALGIAVDESGAWLTDISGQAIAHVAPDGSRDEVHLPGPLAQLGRLALAPDGSVWFADSWANSVTRLRRDHQLEPHPVAESNAAPFGVAVAGDGSVWATLQIANKLVRIGPDGGTTEFDVLTRNATPTDIAVDASGEVWFTELRGNKIGHFAGNRFSEIELPDAASGLTSLSIAPDGAVWFTEVARHSLGRVRNGSLTEFALDRADARPFSVVVSASGDVWYVDLGGWIGRLPAARAQADPVNLQRILAGFRG